MNKNKILICDDQASVHETIGAYLKSEGMEYISAYDGVEAIEQFNKYKPNLMLLDLMMPRKFGTDVCKEIRKESDVPIIMLTAKGETIDAIVGLEIGADDYITKPFSPREVVTRIKTVLRRSGNSSMRKENHVVKQGNLKVDMESHEAYIQGELINLTLKELKIIYMLGSNPSKTLTREYILSEVWGYDYFGDTRVVDTQIKRLRKKINEYELDWEIKAIYGVGYKFELI